ncbi:MAG: hypothetical protein WDO71_19525 [Bacteroidota bacterium]
MKLVFVFLLICNLTWSQNKDSVYTDINEALLEPLKVRSLQIVNQDLKVMPVEVATLKNIRELIIINSPTLNFEEALRYFSTCNNLVSLYLDDNKLIALPNSLTQLKSLKPP